MKGKHILIIEDNQRQAEAMSDWLEPLEYRVTSVHSGRAGLVVAKTDHPDVIVLDIIMSSENEGFQVLKGLRANQATRDIPVVVFSVTGDQVENRIQGLRLGAYYYLLKTKSLIELQAMIERALQIADQPAPLEPANSYRPPLDFCSKTGAVWIDGQKYDVSLTPLQSDLLDFLVERRGQICSRDEIAEHVYKSNEDLSNAAIDRLVSRLRDKLNDDPHQPRFIESVRGIGYKLRDEPLLPDSAE
ncbi:MAG TPA: response regulator transcription factor [Roseiflexaceae bacterium]|nr:response regulator transcription factor [Roseiflexaceae bacterium]